MNLPPVIGITTYARDEHNELKLPIEYVEAVRRAGGLPLLIPPGECNINHLLDQLAGLILAGGGDIDPTRYQGSTHAEIYMVDHERDELEISLAQAVIEKPLPTLAICRGIQIINTACGGSLYPHLPDDIGEQIHHRRPPRNPIPHDVVVAHDSKLATILGTTQLSPMSWHHQAIDRVASNLRVVAHAPDGVVEACEMKEHPWLVGVQWHPELTAANEESQQRLFDELVKQAYKAQPHGEDNNAIKR